MSNSDWEEGRDEPEHEEEWEDYDEGPVDNTPDKWHYLDRSVLADNSSEENERYLEWQEDLDDDELPEDPNGALREYLSWW